MTTATVRQAAFTTATTADAAIYIAPARFDVHAIDALVRWANDVVTTAATIVIDLRMVDFMDNQMINEIDDLRANAADNGVTVELANLSAAAALTLDLLQRAAA